MMIFSALATTVSLAGCIIENPGDDEHLPKGAPMPSFSVAGPAGTVTAGDLAGMRTLVVMFRTTCPDCQRELPKVEAAFEALGSREDIRFVAVSKESENTVAEYWTKRGYTVPWYLDGNGAAFSAFDAHYVPTLYLFGTDGKVAFAAVEDFDFDAAKLIDKIEALQ